MTRRTSTSNERGVRRPPARIRTRLPAGAAAALLLCVPAGLEGQAEPPPLPVENDLVRVVDHPGRGELEVVVGPVDLPAGGPHLRLPVQMVTLPIDGWLHGFDWEMRDAAGNELPDGLLHHVNLIDPDNRELFAPIPRRVLAAGRETPKQRMPRLLGYPIPPGTRILVSSMFANPTGRNHEEAYLHVRLLYSREEDRLIRPRNVYPFYLEVMGPVGPKSFPLPPGRTVRRWEGSPAIDGRLLAIGGHLHDFGEYVRLVDVTEGKVLFEARPVVNAEGRVVSLRTGHLWWKGGIRIHRDRVYRIEVAYENPLDGPAPDGGMGVLGGVVLASGDGEWPPLDRHHVAYVEDLRNTLEEPFRESGHGGHGAGDHGDGGHGGHGEGSHEDPGDGDHDHGHAGPGDGNHGSVPDDSYRRGGAGGRR